MIKVLFFAQIREMVGMDSLDLDVSNETTAEAVRSELVSRGGSWPQALEHDRLLVAINHNVSPMDAKVSDGDELAFFPPVTGG